MQQVFTMEGRLGRQGYVMISLGLTLAMYAISFMVGFVMGLAGMNEEAAVAIGVMVGLAFTVLHAFQAVKRFHDLGRPGSHYWLMLVPFYNIYISFVLLLSKGVSGSNQYGDDLVGATATG